MTNQSVILGLTWETWKIVFEFVLPLLAAFIVEYIRYRRQRIHVSNKLKDQDKTTITISSIPLLISRYPTTHQQRIGQFRRAEIVVIFLRLLLFSYAIYLAILLPSLLPKILNQTTRIGLITLLILLFIFTLIPLIWSIMVLIWVRNRITSFTAKHMTIIVNKDKLQLLRCCISALLNMHADIVSLDLRNGFIEAELSTGIINIRVTNVGDGIYSAAQILSDTFLPSNIIDYGRNSKILSFFINSFFECSS